MRLWQHLCIGSLLAYFVGLIATLIVGLPEKPGPPGVLLIILLAALPCVLGPLAFAALVVDICARFIDRDQRTKWILLCMLVPVAFYYWIRVGFRPLPRNTPHDLPPPPPSNSVGSMPPPLGAVPPLPASTNCSAALTSLVFGGVSWLAVGLPLLVPLSVIAIFCGHKGLKQIKQANGALDGRSLALVGLGMGYGTLIMSLVSAVIWVATIKSVVAHHQRNAPENLVGEPGYIAAREAERCMDEYTTLGGDGNTAEARVLAAAMSERIVNLQLLNFTRRPGDTTTRLDSPPFLYCYLRDDSCVVLFRTSLPLALTPKEDHELNSVVWAEVHDALAERQSLPKGSSVAAAVRVSRKYSDMFLGTFEGPTDASDDIPAFVSPTDSQSLDSLRKFYSYFAPKADAEVRSTVPAADSAQSQSKE